MDVYELKSKIESNEVPKHLVFIETSRVLVKEYTTALSRVLNRRPVHMYTSKEVKESVGRFDRNDLLIIAHNLKIDTNWMAGLDINIIFINSEDVETPLPKIVFPKLSKNQCLLYLENWVSENKFSFSRENQEKLITYFDNDLDQIKGELDKLECLEVKALDRPFQALFECLPDKEKRLRSLPWYSGGAVDTATVLYNTYMKKLKSIRDTSVPINKQRWYAQLIQEAVFVEIGILSGTFGDYALEYFRLIEKMSPREARVQWLPPVSMKEIKESYPEWLLVK